MKHFFTSLNNLKLIDFDCEFIEIIPGLKITNCKTIKDKILTDPIKDAIGIIDTNHFYQSSSFVYYEYEDNEPLFKDLTNLQSLEIILIWIDDILKNSWLYTDNCIVCDTAYLIDNNPGNKEASSLRLQYLFTSSTGKIQNCELRKRRIVGNDCHA